LRRDGQPGLAHKIPDTPEIGGMRYVYPAQKLMTGLVEKVLRLPFHLQTVDVPSNIAFLRGRLLRTSALADPAALPYRFDPAEAAWLSARPAALPPALIERVKLAVVAPLVAAARAARGEDVQTIAQSSSVILVSMIGPPKADHP
jgi:hypothetical protein